MTYQSIQLVAEKAVRQPERSGAAGQYRHPRVSMVQRPWPTLSAGQVLLKVCNTTICGTDIHVLQTDPEGYCCSSVPARHWETGIQFGHEMAAQIIAAGPGVHGLQIGEYVTADSLVPCRDSTCRACRTGQWNACPKAYLLGLQADGVFGEFAVAPASSVHTIQPLVRRFGLVRALRAASLAEPLGAALHSFHQARRWRPEDRPGVLVLGAGPIGLFLAWTARLTGSRRIVVVEPNPRRAENARQFADQVLHPDEFDSGPGGDAFGIGPDIIFDACGHADMNQIVKVLAPAGVVVTVARTGQQLSVACDPLITHGQAIVGARGHVGYLPQAIEMLGNGGIDPDMFITRTLDGMSQLFDALREPRELCDELKVSCRISSPDTSRG